MLVDYKPGVWRMFGVMEVSIRKWIGYMTQNSYECIYHKEHILPHINLNVTKSAMK